jgi:hypothetical protein
MFPEVMIARGGFDLILGNPPWDAMSPDVKEWFAKYDPAIRFMSPDDQKARLEELLGLPGVREGWEAHQQALYRAANFMRNSGRLSATMPVSSMSANMACAGSMPSAWFTSLTHSPTRTA